MCQDCGCGDPEIVPVEVQQSLLAKNDAAADHNREHFAAAGVLAINIMGSPGSGKTALLESTARSSTRSSERSSEPLKLVAMSGDLATDRDARRLEAAGIPARAITTGQACHLDAGMVHRALHHLAGWEEADVVFVENVGNLVCPAIYDLGQAANVVCLAITEGEDKPLKYPVMFQHCDLVLITKIDLLPHLPGFSLAALEENLARVMPEPRAFAVSAVTGEGLEAWIAWLNAQRLAARAAGPARGALGHSHGHSHDPAHEHEHEHPHHHHHHHHHHHDHPAHEHHPHPAHDHSAHEHHQHGSEAHFHPSQPSGVAAPSRPHHHPASPSSKEVMP